MSKKSKLKKSRSVWFLACLFIFFFVDFFRVLLLVYELNETFVIVISTFLLFLLSYYLVRKTDIKVILLSVLTVRLANLFLWVFSVNHGHVFDIGAWEYAVKLLFTKQYVRLIDFLIVILVVSVGCICGKKRVHSQIKQKYK